MLVSCKQGCSGKKGSTNALIDLETDQVICESCGEEIAVSPFTKSGMKQMGDFFRNTKKKPFQFDCETCSKNVAAELVDGEPRGAGCEKKCKFNISKFALIAMQHTSSSKISDDK